MKTTYKLFGVYWDGMDSNIFSDSQLAPSPSDNHCHSISFRDLLSVNDGQDYAALISCHENSQDIILKVDYWPDTLNPILIGFLKKRLHQVVSHLTATFANVYFANE